VWGETLRHALNRLAEIAPHWVKARVPQEWYERYGPRFEQYRLPKTDKERESLALQVGRDGHQVLSWMYAPDTPAALQRQPAVEILRRVWVQPYYWQEEEVFWRQTDNMPPTEQVLQAPYDLDARYSQKRQTEWFGYKAHITETCEDELPHLIPHVETTLATKQDEQVTDTIHHALEEKNLLPREHLLDRGYVNTAVLSDSQENHGVEVIGPVKVDTTWQAQAGKGFDVSCFTIAWEQRCCTNSHRTRSLVSQRNEDEDQIPHPQLAEI